jgi:hypothetical protein
MMIRPFAGGGSEDYMAMLCSMFCYLLSKCACSNDVKEKERECKIGVVKGNLKIIGLH